MKLTYTIYGKPITKKNSQQICYNKATGRRFVGPSPQYQDYAASASYYLKPAPVVPVDTPVNVQCLYYMPTHRRVDQVNLLEATLDILVEYGVLADDNSNIVVSHDGSRVLYDKNNPRTEITITDVDISKIPTGEVNIAEASYAEHCLSVAAQFAEKHGLVIVGERDKTGKVVYWFERRSHERNHF